MRIPPFRLEQFFARYEFNVAHLLCASDVEGVPLAELLALADPETRTRYDGLKLGYTEAWGDPLLRAEIARDYAKIDREHVLVCGAQEAIFLTMNTLLGPGDHAIVAFPAYQSLYEVARAAGADVTLLRLEAGAGWQIDPQALKRALRPTTKLIVVNYPHNPSGALITQETQREVVAVAREAGVHLFFDEVYRFLEHDRNERLPPAADLYDKAISYSAFSKAYGLAGLRLGWLATEDRALLERILAMKDYTSICQSAPSEALALIALRARDKLVARSLEIIRTNLELCDAFFAEHEDVFAWKRPKASSVALVRYKRPERADAFVERLVQATGVLLLPASAFELDTNDLRIGFGRRGMAAGLEKLGAYLV
ncbi:MAG: aminotransferase class I/II-fold pyridoxal phosphate-dependent enzyme [Deltaproteobacteria bacterium]|nr:aminotransferase class I/II-fold pyridoxal phosphate-dependent enzyme [Deltaproteobacteria bacterium]